LLSENSGKLYTFQKHAKISKNFRETLPEIWAEQANDMLKSSYDLGFGGLTQAIKETELELCA
jgi:hypothetical protein